MQGNIGDFLNLIPNFGPTNQNPAVTAAQQQAQAALDNAAIAEANQTVTNSRNQIIQGKINGAEMVSNAMSQTAGKVQF